MFRLPRLVLCLWTALIAAVVLPSAVAQTDELSKLYPPAYVEVLKKAIRSFTERDYTAAIRHLDEADKMFAPSLYSLNMRGAIAIEQKQFGEGEKYCHAALKENPKFFPARFNLAEIPFVQKRYAESRKGFEALLEEDPKNELLQFRVFMTHLLEKNDEAAQKALEAIRFPSNTAAYYYAHAAWEFAHGNEEKAFGWVKSGDWVFPPSRNLNFANVLYDLGWLKRPEKAETAKPTP